MTQTLHPLETHILKILSNKPQRVIDIIKKTGLDQGQVRKALAWLADKELAHVDQEAQQIISLGQSAKKSRISGLPEKRVLKIVEKSPQPMSIIRAKLDSDEFNHAIGFLKKQGYVSILDGVVHATSLGRGYYYSKTDEERVLELLFEKEYDYHLLPEELQTTVHELAKRKGMIEIKNRVQRAYNITKKGVEKRSKVQDKALTGKLTPALLKKKEWGLFREYDIHVTAPRVYGGRKHVLREIEKRVKEIFIEMGFEEMRSNFVDTAFWNFDVMFFPQDHPGREIMDTYYLDFPKEGNIPRGLAKKIKDIHETGGSTGSKGHQYEWSERVANQLLLRAHTTQTSFRYLAKGRAPPYKYFSVDRVFRNETLDATHLNEFHQIEGFVVAKGLTLKNLCGMFKEFYQKIGVNKVKFKPTYNPYTEPSMEIFGYWESQKKWLELGNSGMFRPETLKPLGITVPVIAWGLALERLVPFQYKVDDIRQVLGHFVDIDSIRNAHLIRGLIEYGST
ncbi:phenylalanine--tRNA ligase subunit alpha [archaeon CG10_big_fil_rev_8_21_14_0_10_43_11]|nr:MAG: phenylalanine--tRNA ligase subunit alpha [archaeon CG10_big_fil_rev_8_21_14_0_10_43_11]